MENYTHEVPSIITKNSRNILWSVVQGRSVRIERRSDDLTKSNQKFHLWNFSLFNLEGIALRFFADQLENNTFLRRLIEVSNRGFQWAFKDSASNNSKPNSNPAKRIEFGEEEERNEWAFGGKQQLNGGSEWYGVSSDVMYLENWT